MKPDNIELRGRSISLVGLMGVGKSTIGRRLAKRLEMPVFDSDDEIEKASGRTVKGYFKEHGESAFRSGERRVIKRLLSDDPIILSTGGGAFIPAATRKVLQQNSITVWLKADFDTVMERVNRQRSKRPLLDVPDPEAAMRALMDARYPIYSKAHLVVPANATTHGVTVEKVVESLKAYYER